MPFQGKEGAMSCVLMHKKGFKLITGCFTSSKPITEAMQTTDLENKEKV